MPDSTITSSHDHPHDRPHGHPHPPHDKPLELSRESEEVIPYDQALARWLMQPLVKSPVRPNHITTLSLAFGIGAALLFALGGPLLVMLAPIAFILSRVLDHADGELARLSRRTSRIGHKYDIVADFLTTTILFVGIGFGQAAGPLGQLAPILGLFAGLTIALIYLLHGGNRACGPGATDKQLRLGRFEIEDVLYITAPITWLGALTPYLVAAAVGAPAFTLFALWQCFITPRLRRLPTPPPVQGTTSTPGSGASNLSPGAHHPTKARGA